MKKHLALAMGLLAGVAAAQAPYTPAEEAVLALLAYEPALNLGETPVVAARDRVRRNLRNPDAWHDLGESLDAAGDLPGALDAYEHAAKLPPQDIGRAYLYRDLAEARERSGDLDGALRAARASVTSWPKSREGLFCNGYEEKMLVRILIETHNSAEASAFYSPLQEAEPEEETCKAIGDALNILRADESLVAALTSN